MATPKGFRASGPAHEILLITGDKTVVRGTRAAVALVACRARRKRGADGLARSVYGTAP